MSLGHFVRILVVLVGVLVDVRVSARHGVWHWLLHECGETSVDVWWECQRSVGVETWCASVDNGMTTLVQESKLSQVAQNGQSCAGELAKNVGSVGLDAVDVTLNEEDRGNVELMCSELDPM